ncbi:MAG: hypothetical protein ACC652_05620 [Acidimicrobiales bacterium]
MSSVDRIQSAEDKLAEVQQVIAVAQVGLEGAEAIAVVAENTRRRFRTVIGLAIVLVGLMVVARVARRRRSQAGLEAEEI